MDQHSHGGGVRVGGRYELGELLGRGGMAEVRSGTDIRLGRTVAVKRLRTDLASDPTFQARFRREAQSAAGLNHPNIVSVYDTGEEMAADGSHVQPYIVMEYVAGRTLRDVLNDGRKLLPERALEIMAGVLDALDYSHRAGIIHRDIKPANVMLTPSGDVKVMDFGIARAIADGTSTMTQTAAVVGTAQYLSPEQARGETVDSRSDVYSAGCLLYELLAGRPPFVGDSPFSVAYQHVREQAEPPSTHNPELDAALDAIVMKALAKRVGDRYQSAAEMQADVRRYLDGDPVTATVTPAVAAPLPEADATSIFRPASDVDADDEPEQRKRWPLLVLGIVVVALLGGAIAFGTALFETEEPEQATVPQVTNMTLRAAERRLESEGLEIGDVDRVNSDDVPRGRVMEQDPGSGETVDPGTAIDLTVSAGTEMVTVPFVIGQPRDEAEAELTDAGLEPVFQTEDSDEPADTVLRTSPDAAESVAVGSTVTVVVSTGPAEVPNVVGLAEDAAVRRLDRAGFEVQVETDTTTPADPGRVLSQTPEGLTEATRGSTVTIVVSDYEEPTPTEEVTPTDEATPPEDENGDGEGTETAEEKAEEKARAKATEPSYPRPADASGGVGGAGEAHLGRPGERRSLDELLLDVPAELVLVDRLEVGAQVGTGRDLRPHRVHVADRGDDVRRRVGHAVEEHGVADALDAGRRDHPLALEGHRLGTRRPHRVGDGLDVLLVDDRVAGVLPGRLPHLPGGVVEGDRHPGTLDRRQPCGHLQRLDLLLQLVHPGAVEPLAQRLDLRVEPGDVRLEPLHPGGLLLCEVGEVGVGVGPQVDAVGVDRARRQQDPRTGERERGEEPPAPRSGRPDASRRSTAVPARSGPGRGSRWRGSVTVPSGWFGVSARVRREVLPRGGALADYASRRTRGLRPGRRGRRVLVAAPSQPRSISVSKPRSAAAPDASRGSSISVVRTAIAGLLAVGGLAYAIYYVFGVLQDGTPAALADLGDWNYLIGFGAMFLGLMLLAHERTPLGRGRGVVVGMLGCFLIGLIWIVVYYVTSQDANVPFIRDLANYNLLVGIGFMATGFVYATKWE